MIVMLDSGEIYIEVNGSEYICSLEIFLDKFYSALHVKVYLEKDSFYSFSDEYSGADEVYLFERAFNDLSDDYKWNNRMRYSDYRELSEKVIENLELFKFLSLEVMS
ncbi:MAG: hypothetical protein ACRCX2_38205 [Paraclostridium sp.]